MQNSFRCFNSSPEAIRLTVMMYIRYPLSLRQVEDLLSERGIDICHETVRFVRMVLFKQYDLSAASTSPAP
jgi:transposase-like protein